MGEDDQVQAGESLYAAGGLEPGSQERYGRKDRVPDCLAEEASKAVLYVRCQYGEVVVSKFQSSVEL